MKRTYLFWGSLSDWILKPTLTLQIIYGFLGFFGVTTVAFFQIYVPILQSQPKQPSVTKSRTARLEFKATDLSEIRVSVPNPNVGIVIIGPPTITESFQQIEVDGDVEVGINLTGPSAISRGQEFNLKAKVEVQDINPVPKIAAGEMINGGRVESFNWNATEYKEKLKAFFAKNPCTFHLDIAKVDQSPQGDQTTSTGEVVWSIVATDPALTNISGNLVLVINSSNVDFGGHLLNSRTDCPVTIPILPDPFFTRNAAVGWIGTFLGSLATLPGILAFIKARRDDKKEKEASDKKGKKKRKTAKETNS